MACAYLIAGANGMLGTALQRVMVDRGERFVAPAESEFDITDAAAVARSVHAFTEQTEPAKVRVLINAAAYTNVEGAEDDEETAYRVNEGGARTLAVVAREAGLRFVHISTDFVFDGRKVGPYVEDDSTHPLSVYGASKLAGEHAVTCEYPESMIVRTAWVFGANGANFPLKVLAAARERGSLSVVADEVGSPTYTVDLARGILGLLDASAPAGVYHLAGSGTASRYELAIEVLRLAGIEVPVAMAKSADFPSKAARPLNSVLSCSKAQAFGVTMPGWRDSLQRFMREAVES